MAEGQQITEEELKNMSPEQIAELQKQNCIFCHMNSGKIPVKKVYEDETCFAVLDINPATKGHMLLIPKEHIMLLPQAPDALVQHLGVVAKNLSRAALRALGVDGTNIFVANGAIAGQRAPHLMLHIIPRQEGDGVEGFEFPEKSIRPEDLQKLQKVIGAKLGTNIEAQLARPQPPTEQAQPAPQVQAPIKAEPEPKVIAEEPEPVVEESSEEETFITSENAKRFHVASCPFADKIPDASRITGTQEELEDQDKGPCECTGLRKSVRKATKKVSKEPKKKELKEVDLDDLTDMLSK